MHDPATQQHGKWAAKTAGIGKSFLLLLVMFNAHAGGGYCRTKLERNHCRPSEVQQFSTSRALVRTTGGIVRRSFPLFFRNGKHQLVTQQKHVHNVQPLQLGPLVKATTVYVRAHL